ncbi:Integrase [Streptococcus agalactiae]|nr:integrase [Streptococcus agalactiae]APO41456.1 integrase [Streptococcus agalactiae]AQX75466.1 hypothetical protein SaSA20_0549c [Streptococcus agalactiae]AUO80167.1 Integrase [Streptococcus agalactiae]AUO86646.1 hypothetical protein SaSA1_0567 [Streptococcus agalactiae]
MDYTIISTYLDYCKSHKCLSSHTLRAYKNDLTQFYNSGQDCVLSYIELLTNSTIKTNTLRRRIASLKIFYSYLHSQKLITDNPFNNSRFQFRTERTLPKTIPYDILKNLFAYLKQNVNSSKTNYQRQKAERNLLIVSLLLSTGIRISELCHIKLKNINLVNRTLHILGKGKKERIIFLGDEITILLLKTYLANYCNQLDDYLFPGKVSHKPLTEQSVRLVLKTVREQMNLTTTITPHMFRHSFATMLLDNDVDIRYIQQILGHSSIAITQIYTHVSQSKQKEILSTCNPITSIHT